MTYVGVAFGAFVGTLLGSLAFNWRLVRWYWNTFRERKLPF